MNKDFEDFKKYFTEYQKWFGLTGYSTYFKYEPIDNGFASITMQKGDMVATVRLDSERNGDDKTLKNVKSLAKHEAIHLLIGRLNCLAGERFATSAEIYEACEELAYKLEGLIKE